MSLATRCTSCGTVFRVVQDQLKVSEGWVRCGRCDAVFNALEGLFDLQRDAPPEWAAAPDSPPAQRAPPAQPAQPVPPAAIPEAAAVAAPGEPAPPSAAPPQAGSAPGPDLAAAAAGGNLDAPQHPPGPAQAQEHAMDGALTPEFLREDQRPSRWGAGRARLALGFAAALLLAGLAGQAAHHFRDLLAARWPVARAPLTMWCQAIGCRVEAARRIEDIAVESTALTRVAGPDSYRLSVALRNRGPMVLALPSLDLSLTDSNGEVVARRALGPGDFRSGAATIAPAAEAVLQLTLATGSSRVVGYTVEIFYP